MSVSAGTRIVSSNFNLIPVTPTVNSSIGTPTSGTTETRDDVLGTYQFTAQANTRYLAVIDGLLGNGSVVADFYALRIRDSGSSSAPTAASTVVAESSYYVAATGSGGRNGASFQGTFFVSTAGVHTIAFFAQRIGGTGVFTPVSGFSGANRELYVMAIGSV